MNRVQGVFMALFLMVSFAFAADDSKAGGDKSVSRDDALLPQTGSRAGSARSAETSMAANAFRLGVLSYYRGEAGEAAILFEKALSYKNDDNLILDWLGKAYYKSGMEGEALAAWREALDKGYGGLLLQGKVENVEARRLIGSERKTFISSSYTQSGTFSGVIASPEAAVQKEKKTGFFARLFGRNKDKGGKNNGTVIFSEPTGVLSLDDGSVWIASYGTNELLRLNVNGNVFNRITGPMGGFHRPMDVIRLKDGNMLLSESTGDCLALLKENGQFIKRIGEKGRGAGQMVGPQYLAEDENGNIYVSDYGNRRVDVFGSDGAPLFYIGTVKHKKDTSDGERREFNGLKGPTGIAIFGEGDEERLFVADDVTGGVYEFDRAGNFVRVLVEEGTFNHPEAMKVCASSIIICDGNRVCSIDAGSGEVSELSSTGNGNTRAMSAVFDVNGNMLVADMKASEVLVMSDMSEVLGSLFTQIERVHSENFPYVTLEVRVEDRHRRAIVGLREENFHITENGENVLNQSFNGAASNNTALDVCIVIDRSLNMSQYNTQVAQAVHDIAQGMGGAGTLHVICAGKMPTEEYRGLPQTMMAFKAEAIRTPFSSEVPLDKALRLAGSTLINGEKKRAIILVTGGDGYGLDGYSVSDSPDGLLTSQGIGGRHTFDDYTLSQVSSYLNNNNISLSVVNVTEGGSNEEVSYLCNSTEGEEYYVFRPEGLTGVVKDLVGVPNGLYEISYTSQLPTNMGEAYLKVEAETYLLRRSGRDESGYFAPLQ